MSADALAATITKIHRARRGKLAADFPSSMYIVGLFHIAVSYGILDEVKNSVSAEDADFLDLTDLLAEIHPVARVRLVELFVCVAPPVSDSVHALKLVSDLDNTVFESPISAMHYARGEVIPGVVPLILGVTGACATTPTFISARPKPIENMTISRKRDALRAAGLRRFSFAAGELAGPALFVAGARRRGSERMAAAKIACYRALRAAYPHSAFVFLGDDTQGDWIAASEMVVDDARNFAFIRRIAPPEKSVFPGSAFWPEAPAWVPYHPRILAHTSYYQAIYSAPPDVLPPKRREIAIAAARHEITRAYTPDAAAKFENLPVAKARDTPWIRAVFPPLNKCINP